MDINNDDIAIITTGGTIDKVHDKLTEALVMPPDAAPAVREILRHGRSRAIKIIPLINKDSNDVADEDLERLLHAVREVDATRIVITHGTSKLADTAQWLSERVQGKTVILTGAMRPYSFGNSDAAFNIGGAVLAAQTAPDGVYGVMNGLLIPARDLKKDLSTGRFDTHAGLDGTQKEI
ncbi:MAG: asparaginase domain-containing protein [Pseudomonadota bacterium]